MLRSKRKCRSTWNIQSWHPLSLHPKLRSLWPIVSPACRSEGSPPFVPTYMELRSAWQLHLSGPLWGPFSSTCKSRAQLLDLGNTMAHLGAVEQIHSIPLLWYSNHPALIFFFHRLSLRECFSRKSDSMNVRSQLIERSQRCGARIQTQPTLLVIQATLQQLKWEHQHIFLHSSTF